MVTGTATKTRRTLLVFLFMCWLILCASTADAAHRIDDKAGLFYSNDIASMEEIAARIDEDYHMNVLVLTDQNRNGMSARDKADNAYEAAGYCDNQAAGGICILIDMGNREAMVIADRKMIRFITDSREEKIYDAGYGYLSNAEYGDSMIAMLEQVEIYLKKGIPGGQYTYDPLSGKISRYYSLNAMDLGIAFGGAIIVPLIITSMVVSGYKTIAKYRYDVNLNSEMKITKESERFVNQFVTKRRINTDSSGGGSSGGNRSTTHHSSSGRSFGGGHGRKF